MSSISSLGGSNTFDPSDDNNGQIVSPGTYENMGQSKRDISNSIMNQLGGGKAYGFNLSDIVSALVAGDMMDQIPDLERQITDTNVRISAVSKLENLMQELQNTTLAPTENGMSPYTIQSSDPNNILIQGQASGSSTPNIQPFHVSVDSIAQTNTWIVGGAQSSVSNTVSGSGELDVSLASGKDTKIQIQDNSSLTSIASQINSANAGVTASVIEQSDGYRLAITSNDTGAQNEMSLSYIGDASDLQTLLNTKTEAQVAANAVYTINGVSMTSAGNSISFNGVSLYLNESGASATISAKSDTNVVSRSITQFVSNYNELVSNLNHLSSSVAGKQYQGSLYQDSDIKEVTSELQKTLLSNLPNGYALSNLGIDYNSDGTLTLNSAKLDSVLADNPELGDQIFSTKMSSSVANIDPVSYNKKSVGILSETKSGTYDVNITQAASAASFISTNSMSINSGSVTIASDAVLSISVTGEPNPGKFDSKKTTISDIQVQIPTGTYTTSQLSKLIQDKINNTSNVSQNNAGVSVTVDSSGHLSISSNNMGANTGFVINSSQSSNVDQLGIAAADMTSSGCFGKDVAGTINGQLSFGDGQYLQAQDDVSGETDASGLEIKYVGSDLGAIGTVTLSRGFSDQLDTLLTGFTQTSVTNPDASGLLARKLKNYQKDLDKNNINSLIQKLKEAQTRQVSLSEMYYKRYQDVNSTLSQMSEVQNYLNSMFGSQKE